MPTYHYLLKTSELILKKKKRRFFEKILINNIKNKIFSISTVNNKNKENKENKIIKKVEISNLGGEFLLKINTSYKNIENNIEESLK